jgi:hypothetical protein
LSIAASGLRAFKPFVVQTLLFFLPPGDSDNSDTDSEEEGGFDSDVEVEKNRTYEDKIYANPMRKTTGTKPHLKEEKTAEK